MTIARGQPEAITGTPDPRMAESININFEYLFSDLVAIDTLLGAALTPVAGAVAYTSSSALALTAAGTSGDVFTSAGTGSPVWTAPGALTKVDDTNVTLTLGGTPTTALLRASSLTLGWTGTLALARGGTAKALTASAGGIVWTDTDSMEVLAGTATAGQMLRSGASVTPAWSTATFPATATTTGAYLRADGTNWITSTLVLPNAAAISTVLYASAADTIAALSTANSGVLVTSGTGVPSIATDIPTAVTIGSAYVYRASGTDVPVADGGTGLSTVAANALLYASALNTIAALTTALSAMLTTNGSGVPTWVTTLPSAMLPSNVLTE